MKTTATPEVKNFKGFKWKDYFTAAMIFLSVGIVPLIVRYALVSVSPDEQKSIRALEKVVDLFSYWKMIIFLLAIFLLVLAYALDFLTGRPKSRLGEIRAMLRNPIVIASMIYMAAVTLSTLFSDYPHTALKGITERYEGVFVLLGYMALMLIVFDFVKSKFQSQIILYGMIFSACIIGIIGAVHFVGIDPFQTALFKAFVLGRHGGDYKPVFTQVYSTLYNPNCVGLYTALMLPITTATAIFYQKNKAVRYILFLVAFLLLLTFIGSRSTGGLVGIIADCLVVAVFALVLCIKDKKRINGKYIGIAVGAFAFLFVVMMAVTPVRDNLSVMANKIFQKPKAENSSFYKGITFDTNTAEIYSEYGKMSIMFDKPTSSLSIRDKFGEKIPILNTEQIEGKLITNYTLEGFGDFNIQSQGNMFAFLSADAIFLLAIDNEGNILPLTSMGQVIDPNVEIPSIGFQDMEQWGSGRGYIWSRTFPLLAGSIFLGQGPDTFAYRFPDEDVSGKMKTFGNPYTIVDKPHNFYLQTAINTGFLSLLAILFIFAYYIVTTFWSLLHSKGEDLYIFGLRFGIFVGICGYLTASLATDSVISVAPVFWAALGMGFALNNYAKKLHLTVLQKG